MTPNSAWSMIPIVEGVDYTQEVTYESVGTASVGTGYTPPIYALLCTTGGTAGNVVLQLLGDPDAGVTMPATTFKQGVIYPMYLRKLIDDNGGNVAFVGLRYRSSPLVY